MLTRLEEGTVAWQGTALDPDLTAPSRKACCLTRLGRRVPCCLAEPRRKISCCWSRRG